MSKILLRIKALLLCGALILITYGCFAQTDTLHVLSYNVLYLGDTPPCQGAHSVLEGYLETVISYANPDIAGFVKAEAIDAHGTAPTGFADSELQYIFNAAYPGRYAYCTYTNTSAADNISVLFYNQQKLGFVNMLCSYSDITDFDTWKLYYKSPSLATTHDSIFLYITLNHTNSGSNSSDAATRETQIAGEMAQIETHFSSLPNMINMGDFNVHSSSEAAYQTLVAPSNPSYRYYDPPFYPDATFSYPADWDDDPGDYASGLTVSTRTGSLPNTCSNDNGGGKSWYDHIFLSANIINDASFVSYVPNSFRVIGNDGNRLGVTANALPNASAPAAVTDAIYQISEHYPVTLSLLVDTSATASVPALAVQEKVTVVNPVASQLTMRFTKDMAGKTIRIACIDALGRVRMNNTFVANEVVQLPCNLAQGIYCLKVTADSAPIANLMLTKQ